VRASIKLAGNQQAVPMNGGIFAKSVGNSDLHVIATVDTQRRAKIAPVIAKRFAFSPREKRCISGLYPQ
jgi:hypothetical protein